jgi:hypothetical protein
MRLSCITMPLRNIGIAPAISKRRPALHAGLGFGRKHLSYEHNSQGDESYWR